MEIEKWNPDGDRIAVVGGYYIRIYRYDAINLIGTLELDVKIKTDFTGVCMESRWKIFICYCYIISVL